MEYFAKIQEPKKLRLSMMKTARESIIMLSIIEEVEAVREQKLEIIDSIKDDFDCIDKLYKEMADIICDEKTRLEIAKAAKDETASKAKPRAKPAMVKESSNTGKTKTDVDRLEYTLKQIEDRIAQLSK